MSEPLMRVLAELPPAEPDAVSAEGIRLRCRAELVQRASRAAAAPTPGMHDRINVWQPVIAVLGIAYLAEAVIQALRAALMQ